MAERNLPRLDGRVARRTNVVFRLRLGPAWRKCSLAAIVDELVARTGVGGCRAADIVSERANSARREPRNKKFTGGAVRCIDSKMLRGGYIGGRWSGTRVLSGSRFGDHDRQRKNEQAGEEKRKWNTGRAVLDRPSSGEGAQRHRGFPTTWRYIFPGMEGSISKCKPIVKVQKVRVAVHNYRHAWTAMCKQLQT